MATYITQKKQFKELIPEETIRKWTEQVLDALAYIHAHKILHRDLKPSNLLLASDGSIKICDFGIAKVLEHTEDIVQTIIGTPHYMSPELLISKPYSFKSDIWSLGCIVHELCTLRRPFEGSNIIEIVSKTISNEPVPISTIYSFDLQNAICQMLQKDPENRPTIHQLCILMAISPIPTYSFRTSGLSVQKTEEPVTSEVSLGFDFESKSGLKNNSTCQLMSSEKLSSKLSDIDDNYKPLLELKPMYDCESNDSAPKVFLDEEMQVKMPKIESQARPNSGNRRNGCFSAFHCSNGAFDSDHKNLKAKSFIITHKYKNKLSPYKPKTPAKQMSDISPVNLEADEDFMQITHRSKNMLSLNNPKTPIKQMSDISPGNFEADEDLLQCVEVNFTVLAEDKITDKKDDQSNRDSPITNRADRFSWACRSRIRQFKSEIDGSLM